MLVILSPISNKGWRGNRTLDENPVVGTDRWAVRSVGREHPDGAPGTVATYLHPGICLRTYVRGKRPRPTARNQKKRAVHNIAQALLKKLALELRILWILRETNCILRWRRTSGVTTAATSLVQSRQLQLHADFQVGFALHDASIGGENIMHPRAVAIILH